MPAFTGDKSTFLFRSTLVSNHLFNGGQFLLRQYCYTLNILKSFKDYLCGVGLYSLIPLEHPDLLTFKTNFFRLFPRSFWYRMRQ